MTVEAFQRHWREVHGPLGARVPGLRRYVQSHTRLSGYGLGMDTVNAAVAQLEAHGMLQLGEQREITPAVSRRVLEAAL